MKEGGSTRGGMKKAREVRKQSVQGSGVRKRWWRNEMGKEDRGHYEEEEFWINIKECFFIGSFINNTIAADRNIQSKARNTPPICLGHKA